MVKLEDAIIAKLEKQGMKFEILVDPELAMKVKKGEKVNISELMAVETIFKDARKATEQGHDALQSAFSTADVEEIAKRIIQHGDVQLTTEQRKEMREKRFREIVQLISRNAVNPQTMAPHPVQRIENAMQQAGVHVDAGKSAEEQLDGIVKALRPIVPISFEKIKFAVKIPAQYAGKAYSAIRHYGVQKEEWQNDGSLIAVLEVPAGIKVELLNELNHLTHGDVSAKILEK